MTAARPRVLLASPRPPPVGGIATWTETVLASPLAREFEMRCVDTAPRGSTDRPSESRFRVGRALHALALVASFTWQCIRFRPAIVHICTSYHWALARDGLFAWIARVCGARTLLHLRGGDFEAWVDRSPRLVRTLAWVALRGAHRVIVLDEPTRARVEAELGRDRVALLQSFVAAPPAGSIAARRPDEASTSRALRLVFVGAVIEAKGILELLEALASLPAAQLELIGPVDATFRPRLDAALASLGSRVRLGGVLAPDDVFTRLREADAFVLPSHREGLPLSMLEAMGAGLPIVATPVGAIPEVVRDGREGLLVPLRDTAALGAALGALAKDPARRRALGEGARRRYDEVFSPDAGLARLRALYAGLLAPPRRERDAAGTS